jgi:galactokinase
VTNLIALATINGFKQIYDREPVGLWSAPGRVNLIGEHTDYNQGFVLPFAINRRTYVAAAPRKDNLICVASSFSKETFQIPIDQIKRDDANHWAAYPFGTAYAVALLSGKEQTQGFDLYIDSDVPVGAGLSSSAALECSVGMALNDLWGTNLDKKTLARAGQLGENEIVGAPTGIMDPTASLFGELDHAVFLDCRTLESTAVELGFAAAGLELLIIDTKISHRLVSGGYAARRASCEAGAAAFGVTSLRDLSVADLPKAQEILDDITLRRSRHIITENERVLETVETLKKSGPRAIGDLLYASHESMRDDFEISIDELDTAVEIAMRHGAVGARMTGGGFGGASIALTPIEKISEVTLSVISEFESLGYAKPDIFAVSAAPGARREDIS